MRLSALYTYPLKSAGAVALAAAHLDACGLEGDRRWGVVSGEGRVLTQRDCPRLATVRVRPRTGGLDISAPDRPPLAVATPPGDSSLVPVSVWNDATQAAPAGEEAARWFSELVGAPCQLVHMPERVVRRVDPRYGREGDRVGLADGFPLLLVSEASLADLNGRLAAPIGADRFRPNLVITGDAPYAEDEWERIRIGRCTFRVVKRCDRCVVTTIDQATGERGREPLRTLSGYRRAESKVYFGQNLAHDGRGTIRRGDAVEVLSG